MFDLPFFDFVGHQAPTNALAFENTSSFDSAGNEYTGDNGYTVVDSYSCGSGECGGFTMGSHPAGMSTHAMNPADTNTLAFEHTSSFDGAGNEYTGDNGYTVVDSYSCGSGECGGFTMGSHPAAPAAVGGESTGLGPVVDPNSPTTTLGPVAEPETTTLASTYTDSTGYVYTGENGYTVTDSYTCGSGSCGGFTMGSHPAGYTAPGAIGGESTGLGPVVDPNSPTTTLGPVAEPETTTLASTYTDSTGYVYTGENGYTVTDSYTCGSGSCGGFTMGSHPAGYTAPGAIGGESTGLGPVVDPNSPTTTLGPVAEPETSALGPVAPPEAPTTSLVAPDPACAPDTGGSDGTCFTVTDPYNEGEGYTVWTNEYEGKVAPELAPVAPAATPLKAGSESRPCKSGPSHFMLCGHAMVLGALNATQAVGHRLIEGERVSVEDWRKEFAKSSEEAVASVSPVGEYLLSKKLLSQ